MQYLIPQCTACQWVEESCL